MARSPKRRRSLPKRRLLTCERLESRHLLAGDSLDSVDELVLAPIDPAEESADFSAGVANDPGSLGAYLEELAADPYIQAELSLVEPGEPTPPRHNAINPMDVDVSGELSPIDALLVINHVHHGDPSLTQPDDFSAPGVFETDVNNDGHITVADAEAVIAALNALDAPKTDAPKTDALKTDVLKTDAPKLLIEGEGEGGPVITFATPPPPIPAGDAALPFITEAEVENLLARAAGATSTQDAIIAIVDRGGRILGVRMEAGVLANIPDMATRIFAIDGAVAKARTAAFFGNNQAPLTSRTIRSLSQTTITEREVESNPTVPLPTAQNPFNNADSISRTFGPGTVAAIGVGGHFPPDIQHTPPVDLFNIELQSRDGLTRPGADGIKGNADDFTLSNRFNVPTTFLPTIGGVPYDVPAPESYGVQSGLMTQAIGRGIATMPGGIPLLKAIPDPELKSPFTVVGGIGVFFPGRTGYATHEQGFVPNSGQTSTQRLNSKKALEAEFIAAKTAGVFGSTIAGYTFPDLNTARIDLVGITLEIVGPNPTAGNRIKGLETVRRVGQALGPGSPTSGDNQIVLPGGDMYIDGVPVPEGWLVLPHDSPLGGITQADVEQIVMNARNEANQTRAAIRLDVSKNPPIAGVKAKMVIAVADKAGNILGLFRQHDSTIFSIDVAVAKARNTAYYADPTALQNADKVDDDLLVAKGAITVAKLNQYGYKNNNGVVGTPDLFTTNTSSRRYSPLTGLAFTNRTFRFLAEPRYPSGVDGSLPPVFSILTDPGINRKTAENQNQANPTPASLFTSVMGFDAFHTSRNFRDPGDVGTPAPGVNTNPLANQNGIVFFPGSSPLYKSQILVGGFGISGDGVDQDDVVTFAGQQGFAAPQNLRADMLFYRGVRLPFQKFNRNPHA